MEGVLVLGFITGVIALLDIAALRFGVDSRPGSTDPRRPLGGIQA